MMGFLFQSLTARPAPGTKAFEAATGEARQRHWFAEGEVSDTLDGRFAVLATVVALILVRLEQLGSDGNVAAVALTERFIAVMESEHRELGLGDPKLGRTVRKLVGSLAGRTELWRSAVADDGEWSDAARQSLYKTDPTPGALALSADALRSLWTRLERKKVPELMDGVYG